MPGESLLKDVAEVLEFYGADRDVPSSVLARFLVECLTSFQKAQILAHPVAEAEKETSDSGVDLQYASQRAQLIADEECRLRGTIARGDEWWRIFNREYFARTRS